MNTKRVLIVVCLVGLAACAPINKALLNREIVTTESGVVETNYVPNPVVVSTVKAVDSVGSVTPFGPIVSAVSALALCGLSWYAKKKTAEAKAGARIVEAIEALHDADPAVKTVKERISSNIPSKDWTAVDAFVQQVVRDQ